MTVSSTILLAGCLVVSLSYHDTNMKGIQDTAIVLNYFAVFKIETFSAENLSSYYQKRDV